MSSHCRVETTSKGYQSGMNSVTDVTSGGDSPHAEFIAGMTAGEVAKGHSSAHADYLARTRNMETYLGSTGRGGGGQPKWGGRAAPPPPPPMNVYMKSA